MLDSAMYSWTTDCMLHITIMILLRSLRIAGRRYARHDKMTLLYCILLLKDLQRGKIGHRTESIATPLSADLCVSEYTTILHPQKFSQRPEHLQLHLTRWMMPVLGAASHTSMSRTDGLSSAKIWGTLDHRLVTHAPQ